jgi:hypothetical protein
MTNDIFGVFRGAQYIKDEIRIYCLRFFSKEYVQKKDKESILSAIYRDVNYSIEVNNFSRINEDLKILEDIFPILTEILKQGVEEGQFHCDFPEEYAQIILSVFTFLLDPGIFHWSLEEVYGKCK